MDMPDVDEETCDSCNKHFIDGWDVVIYEFGRHSSQEWYCVKCARRMGLDHLVQYP